MAAPRLVLAARTPAEQALAELRAHDLPGAPVVNGDGAFIGSIQADRLAQSVETRPHVSVGRLADVEAMTVPVDAALDAAVDAVSTSQSGWVPVLDSDMRVVGVVASSDLVTGWRMAMRHAIRRLGRAARHAMLVEATVEHGAPADGVRVDELALPRGAVLVAVLRGNGLMFADGDTCLVAGDMVSAFTRRGDEPVVQQLLRRRRPRRRLPQPRGAPTLGSDGQRDNRLALWIAVCKACPMEATECRVTRAARTLR